MRKKSIWMGCLAVMLLCITFVMCKIDSDNVDSERADSDTVDADEIDELKIQGEDDFLPVYIIAGGSTLSQNIKVYRAKESCYVFLPSYTDLSALVCSYGEAVSSVSIGGQALSNGETIEKVEIGKNYEIMITDRKQNVLKYPLIFLQSENLPSVFIDTVSGSMDYINAVKGNEEPGYFTCICADGVVDSQSLVNRIRGRGNTSWSNGGGKNQYNVRLKEASDVLGMGSARNWVIQSNKFDVSMMKNKLSYDFAKDIGVPYAIDSEFADLYLNGGYMGTYLICEKVEIAENRIDPHNEYLIERDDRETLPEETVESSYGKFMVHNPKEMTEGEYDYITAYLNSTSWSIESAEYSDDYTNYIDVESFAKLFIMNEISNDPDANRLSSFFYKEDENNSKLTAGPVWDFDWAYGVDARSGEIKVSGFEDGWFEDLYRSQIFRDCLVEIFEKIMDETYENYGDDYFESEKDYLLPSYYMNMIRWKTEGDIDTAASNLDKSVEEVQEYFRNRIEYLSEVFDGNWTYHRVNFVYDSGKNFTHTYVKNGTTIPKETVEHLLSVYGCVPGRLTNDEEIDWITYVIFEDVDLECQVPETGADE
ncbi:MAG: CotH kinase family protein [Lachnospiraceae bacterium]|nr:CotH kinase family protein [Lachnospiraceae bacterium]